MSISQPTHTAAETPKIRLPDRALYTLLAVYGAAVLLLLLLTAHFFLPAEDAVILHQYSRNLAEHGAITYYSGGPHAEGATDFAWMVLVAAAFRLGITPAWFTAVVNVLALVLLGCALLRLAGLRITLPRVLAIAGSAGLVPQIVAAAAGFSVLLDALLLTLLVAAVAGERTRLAALLGLILCLFRPDGVVFAVPLLGSLLLRRRHRAHRAAWLLLLFVLPGIAYFAWRAHYFHALLPLPFTVKSDVHRTLGVLVPHSFWQSTKYLLFDAVLLFPLLRQRTEEPSTRRTQAILLISIVALPMLFYWTMRLDQNIGDRFFFYLPLAAAIVLAIRWPALASAQRIILLRVGLIAFVLLLLGPLLREVRSFRDYQFDDVRGIARSLGTIPARGSLLTTEAGFLAYGSGWVAYDAWGLNTARFARHFIQPADVAALHPDLIVLHPDMPESCLPQPGWRDAYTGRTWQHMTRNLLLGARDAGDYELWLLSYGSAFYRERRHWGNGQGDRECFLVRRDSPLYPAIVAILRKYHAVGPPSSIAMEKGRVPPLS